MNPRTKTVDTKNPAVNPDDAMSTPPNAAPETQADHQQSSVAALPKGVVPGLRTGSEPEPAAAQPSQAAPPAGQPVASGPFAGLGVNGPGSPKPVPVAEPDPFTLLWKHQNGLSTLRAMEVPGGCIVQRAWISPQPAPAGGIATGALCFVPDARIEDGKLVGDAAP
jgi:hypothetical protein